MFCYTNSATCSTPEPCPQTGLANLSKTTFRTHSKSSRNKAWQTGRSVSILWIVRYCNPTLHLTWCTTLRLVFTCGLNLCSSLLSHTCCASPILLLLSLHAENALLSHQQLCKKAVSFLKLYHTICSYLISTDTTLDLIQRSSESFCLLTSHLYNNNFKALKREKEY